MRLAGPSRADPRGIRLVPEAQDTRMLPQPRSGWWRRSLYPCLSHLHYLLLLAPKTPTPSQAEFHPRGRFQVVRRPNCRGWRKSYGHPGCITITYTGRACRLLPGMSSFFWNPSPAHGSVDYHHQSAPPSLWLLNRQAASDEKAKIGDGVVGDLICPCSGCCTCKELAEISGANVTVSRTHTGFSLCFQIVSTFNRFEVKQGNVLFSNTCEKQRLSCRPSFDITGV